MTGDGRSVTRAGSRPAAADRLLLAGVSARALAASAAQSRLLRARFPAGFVVLDYFGDADLRALAAREATVVLSLPGDLGLPRSVAALGRAALEIDAGALVYASGFENRPRLLRILGRRLDILGNGASEVRPVRDPAVLFPFLAAAGIPHPPTYPGRAAAPLRGGTRHLWKPIRSGGGAGIRPATHGEKRPPGHYLQRLLAGAPGSAIALAGNGGTWAVVLGVTEQLAGMRELGGSGFRYSGNVAGPPEELAPPGAIAMLGVAASAIARRFRLRGLFGIDFLLSDGIPAILEVNPRYSASMELLEQISALNLLDMHLQALDGGPAPRAPLRPPAAGGPRFLAKGILYAVRSTRNRADPGSLQALGCRDVPCFGETIDAGHPICTIVVGGGSQAACRARLVERAGEVRRVLDSPGTADPARLWAASGSW